MRIRIVCNKSNRPRQNSCLVGATRALLAPVARQRVQGRTTNPSVGVIEHRHQVVHDLGHEEVIQKLTAPITYIGAVMAKRLPYRRKGGETAPQLSAMRATGVVRNRTEAIIRETDREFLVEVFPESRLGPDPKMFADLRSGALEFFLAGATLGEVAPTSALPLLPFAFRDSKTVFPAVDGGLGEQIRGELAQNPDRAGRRGVNARSAPENLSTWTIIR